MKIYCTFSQLFTLCKCKELFFLVRYSDWLRVVGSDDRGSILGGRPGIIFSSAPCVQTGSELTQPPIQWIPQICSVAVKWPGREADHSPPSSAEVKNVCSYTSTPHYVFMAWCLVKHSENFTFNLQFVKFLPYRNCFKQKL